MKRYMALCLAIVLMLGTFTGCTTINQEIEQTYKEAFDIAKQGIKREWDELTAETIQTWKDTGQIITDGIAAKAMTTFFSHKRMKKKDDWTQVFVSELGNEAVVISRRHGLGLVGVHCTTYMIELYIDGECKKYTVSPYTPCEQGGFFVCDGRLATMEKSIGGTDIFPYIEDIYGYLMIKHIRTNSLPEDTFKQMLIGDVFNGILQDQFDDVVGSVTGEAKSAAIGLAGDVVGHLMGTGNYLDMLNTLNDSAKDATETYNNTKDSQTETAYYYVPATKNIKENMEAMLAGLISANQYADYAIYSTVGLTPDTWTDVTAADEFTLEDEAVEVRINDSKVQWRYQKTSKWKNQTAGEKIKLNHFEVRFQQVGNKLQRQYVMSNVDIALALAQQALHDKVKEELYAVN